MKTENISVPHFEGYKCLGCVTPEEGHYMLSLNGDRLFRVGGADARAAVVYEKVPPKRHVFEETGEFREVKNGDYYLFENNIFYRSNDEESLSFYKILRKVDEGQN